MNKPYDRQTILDHLNRDWKDYPAAFNNLTPSQQADFLQRQGYRRFGDLLAHVIAWWRLGLYYIDIYAHDSAFSAPPVDVDAFNARVVAESVALSDSDILTTFETAQQDFVRFIQALPDKTLVDERVQNQLEMELFEHFQEHAVL